MSSTTARAATRTHPVRSAARLVGIVFLVIGVLGFVPGVTSNFGDMTFAGHMSDAKLLGLFQVSALHDIVHLLFGVLGLALSNTASRAKLYLIVGGVVYLVLWIYGLVVNMDSSANFVPLNSADNWLHFFLGVGMVLLGVVLGRGIDADNNRRTV